MSFASFADNIPSPQHVRPAAQWLVKELNRIIGERDAEEQRMRNLGVGGLELSAHRDATASLRAVAARWERALGQGSAT